MRLTIELDDKTYTMFQLALSLEEADDEEVIRGFINEYCRSVIAKESNSMPTNFLVQNQDSNRNNSNDEYYGKAKRKISRWASKGQGIPHRIIKAYLLSEKEGIADLEEMRRLCTNKDRGDLYVGDSKKFDTNFSQMKYDSIRSHGHVFDVFGTRVSLWNEVEEMIYYYEKAFREN